MKRKLLFICLAMGIPGLILAQLPGQLGQAQGQQPGQQAPKQPPLTPAQLALQANAIKERNAKILAAQKELDAETRRASEQGLEVQIQSIAHFRGAKIVQLSGLGVVIGLQGTGDTTKQLQTQTVLANYYKAQGITVDPTTIAAKNVAIVLVTATLPAFSKTGKLVDVTVSSMGDATSLQGGLLVPTALYGPTDKETVIVSATGPLSIGGFGAAASGSSTQKNHLNVGRVPGGGEVQNRLDTKVVFNGVTGNILYLDLDEPNPVTLTRVVKKLNERYKDFNVKAIDDSTVSITVPQGEDPSTVMSRVSETTVYADTPAKIVINERTGTIVVGGSVQVGPAMIVSGSLNVRIEAVNEVSQPGPFSNGTTTPISNAAVSAGQENAKIAILKPITTVSELARIFQALQLKPNDVIQILQALAHQGALKARIELE